MLRILRALLLVAMLPVSVACEQVKKIDVPALPKVDLPNVPLPKSAGNLLLIKTPAGGLELNPASSDAITAVGNCTDLITYCYEPGTRSIDECVESVPTCQTSKPWEEEACCPAACVKAYSQERKQGQEPIAAFETSFFLEPDCFPGVRSLLEAP